MDRNSSKECYSKCEDNFRCKFYTYDEREKLCYLKYTRGNPRNRTDGFISGSTDREGCDKEECRPPYSYYSYQCMFYCDEYTTQEISLADVRRNYNQSRDFCDKFGGFLPYEFQGSNGYQDSDSWHWLGYPGQGSSCWAGRPGYFDQGVQSFPCTENLNFACQRSGRYPVSVPQFPELYQPRQSLQSLPRQRQVGSGWPGYYGRRRLGLARRRYLLNQLFY